VRIGRYRLLSAQPAPRSAGASLEAVLGHRRAKPLGHRLGTIRESATRRAAVTDGLKP